MGRARAQEILGLVPSHWWVDLGPGVSGCRGLGILDTVLSHWCVWLGPQPSGGQGHVQGWLWAQEVLRQVGGAVSLPS